LKNLKGSLELSQYKEKVSSLQSTLQKRKYDSQVLEKSENKMELSQPNRRFGAENRVSLVVFYEGILS